VEEAEGPEAGSSGTEPTGAAGIDPVAIALALNGASREKADAFLEDQRAFVNNQSSLIDIQKHHLQEQFGPQFRQLHLGVWEKRLGVLLRIATAFTGVAVAAGVAFLVWNASASNDLVIDSFQVPPDLAAKGLSGPVVAAKLSDKIAAMQAETVSSRPAKSYAGLSDGLKLEIPETGISLSELDRFLRQQLGHDLHIGGEMVQTDKGVALTARVGADSATVAGAESDVDTMLQALAEQVYRKTQPYRFAVWLEGHGRIQEAAAIFRTMATSGPVGERPWAYNGWGNLTAQFQSEAAALALFARGQVADPDFYPPILNISGIERHLGRIQASQRDNARALELLVAHGRTYARPQSLTNTEDNIRGWAFRYHGALLEAAEQFRQAIANGGNGAIPLAEDLTALHEPGQARAALADRNPAANDAGRTAMAVNFLHARLAIALEAQNWPDLMAAYGSLSPLLAQSPGFAEIRRTFFDPLVAVAEAHMGQFVAAQARLGPMPADCYPCLIARAQVAALQRQNARADWWFARAAAAAPSMPFADSDWGHALLAHGEPDAAIAKFTAASQKGPHFADPLEIWSEALMAKNQSHLALAKFEEADNYAPNWGRLHLKWGEALVYAGKRDEARAQFARAAHLDLTPAEKAELARQSPHA
jgi:tetratricopeptide (TPR) repeat protein